MQTNTNNDMNIKKYCQQYNESRMHCSHAYTAYSKCPFNIFNINSSIGFPCPGNFNPADFFIRTLTVNPTEYEQSVERIKVSHLNLLMRAGLSSYMNC